MNKFLLSLTLSIVSLSNAMMEPAENYNEISSALNRPLVLQEAVQEIVRLSGALINENDIRDGISELKKERSIINKFNSYFAFRLENSDSFSLTNKFFSLLQEYRKKIEIQTKDSLPLYGSIHNKHSIANGVLNGDAYLLAQDEDGLALFLTFSPEEPKVTFTLIRAEWSWGSSSWGDFEGFSYFSHDYNAQTKQLSKRYTYDSFFDKKDVWY